MIVPVNRLSRLLAPTDTPVEPSGISQRCVFVFQNERSYRERLKDTVSDCPGVRKTLSKPFRLNGAAFADAGGEVYNWGLCGIIDQRPADCLNYAHRLFNVYVPRVLLQYHCS